MDLIGGEASAVLKIFLVFVFVLALIGIAAWLVRRFGGNKLGVSASRGRMPRLALIDTAVVDGRRRLILIRRDNVEHLIMIGGPSDILIEPNILRAPASRDQAPNRGAIETGPRVAPLPDAPWSETETAPRFEPVDLGEPAPMPEPPPRPVRPAPASLERPMPERRTELFPAPAETPARAQPATRPETAVRAEPAVRVEPAVRAEPIVRPEPASRPASNLRVEPPVLRTSLRTEPATPRMPPAPEVQPVTPPAAAPLSPEDQNLAEMAQRLEAALRRSGATSKMATPAAEKAPPAPQATAAPAPTAPAAARGEAAALSVSPVDKIGAPSVTPEQTSQQPTPSTSSGFSSLEEEMASLLGRPKNPS